MAARMPAQPAPTTRTSCSPITSSEATASPRSDASRTRPGRGQRGFVEPLEVLAEHLRQLARLLVVDRRIAPCRARIEEGRVPAGHCERDGEPEDLVRAVLDAVELPRQGGVQHRPGG